MLEIHREWVEMMLGKKDLPEQVVKTIERAQFLSDRLTLGVLKRPEICCLLAVSVPDFIPPEREDIERTKKSKPESRSLKPAA